MNLYGLLSAEFLWLVLIAFFMIFIAAATVSIQSLKAAVANLIDGLRSE